MQGHAPCKKCGRGEDLGTTTCPRTEVGASKGMLPVKSVVEVKTLGPPHVLELRLGQARACSL